MSGYRSEIPCFAVREAITHASVMGRHSNYPDELRILYGSENCHLLMRSSGESNGQRAYAEQSQAKETDRFEIGPDKRAWLLENGFEGMLCR